MTFFKHRCPTQLLKILKIWFHIWIALEMYFRIHMDYFFSISTPSPLKMGAKLGNISKISWFSIFWTIQPFFIIFCIKIEYHKTFKMMMSFFWKNACLPQKRAKRSKSGWGSWKNKLFCILLKIGSLDFVDILHKVRGH